MNTNKKLLSFSLFVNRQIVVFILYAYLFAKDKREIKKQRRVYKYVCVCAWYLKLRQLAYYLKRHLLEIYLSSPNVNHMHCIDYKEL
jgi:hypothetical protein